jgi:deoxyribose-phosphate aldolase
VVGEKFGIKATGAIPDPAAAQELISAGATRLGIFSVGAFAQAPPK